MEYLISQLYSRYEQKASVKTNSKTLQNKLSRQILGTVYMAGLKEEIATVHSFEFLFKRKLSGLNKFLRELYGSKPGIVNTVLVFRLFQPGTKYYIKPSYTIQITLLLVPNDSLYAFVFSEQAKEEFLYLEFLHC